MKRFPLWILALAWPVAMQAQGPTPYDPGRSLKLPHIGGSSNIKVLGHLTLAEGVNVSAATLVSRSIHKPGLYSGVFPFDDNATWEKNAASLKQLYRLRERVRALEKKITP